MLSFNNLNSLYSYQIRVLFCFPPHTRAITYEIIYCIERRFAACPAVYVRIVITDLVVDIIMKG